MNDSPKATKESPAESEQRVSDLVEQLQQRTVELEEANRELRFISHYRSLFLARMSHELRTPLTSILGFTEILIDQEKLTETQQRFCGRIQSSGMQLLTSLNQLVDLSRLEVEASQVFPQEFSLGDTLRESCGAVARLVQKQGVALEYGLSPEIFTVVTDQGRLRQILYTFLAWSISRSREGQAVKIHAEQLGDSILRIQIWDEGEPVTDVLRVFDPADSPQPGKTDLNELGIIVGKRLLDVISGTVNLGNLEAGLLTTIQIPVGQPKQ